jgi:superfamily II DNA helicase RecQ
VRFTLYIEQPWSMIDFVQESGRAREEGQAVVLVAAQQSRLAQLAQPAQLAERAEELAEEEIDDSAAIVAFVRTSGCRRAVMSRYMDGVQVSCREVEAAVSGEAVELCDNCNAQAACRQVEGEQQDRVLEQETGVERVGSGQAAWQENSRVQAAEERVVCRKLSELAEFTCPYCWGILYEVFGREESIECREEEEQAEHRIWECLRLAT